MGQNIYSLNSKVARLLLRRTHLSLSFLPSCLFPLLTRTCLLQISTLVEVSLLTPISARKSFSPVLQLFFLLLLQLVKIIKEEKLFFFPGQLLLGLSNCFHPAPPDKHLVLLVKL